MNYFSEKEKKLEIALDNLKKLILVDEEGLKNIEFLSDQKNQLEIEKKELEIKHQNLINEHQKLREQLKVIKDKNSKYKLDQLKFNEKIDELNLIEKIFFCLAMMVKRNILRSWQATLATNLMS